MNDVSISDTFQHFTNFHIKKNQEKINLLTFVSQIVRVRLFDNRN